MVKQKDGGRKICFSVQMSLLTFADTNELEMNMNPSSPVKWRYARKKGGRGNGETLQIFSGVGHDKTSWQIHQQAISF